jgi:PAS domain S-box-containing protein
MTYTFLQFLPLQRILWPQSLQGWLLWLALFALAFGLALRAPKSRPAWMRSDWLLFAGLTILTPISILLFSLRLPAGNALPIPGIGSPAFGALLPLFAAIPWVFAAARLGALPAAWLAALSGLLLSLWDTRSPFTAAEFALLGALLGLLFQQNYRTFIFKWLRQPLVAAFLISALYPFLYVATAFFWTGNDPVASLDFAFSRVAWLAVSVAAQVLLAGAVLQILRTRLPVLISPALAAQPAPSERSLEARFLFTLGPVVLLAFISLGALVWWSTGRAAEQLLSERMSTSAEVAADSVPFLLETGQNLVLQLASDTRLADANSGDALALLQAHLRSVPYFEQLTLLDTGGNTIAGFPVADFAGIQPSQQELEAVALAIQGISLQYFSVAPLSESATAAQLSFVAAVRNSNNQVRAVLVGRTSLASNPFAQPILASLQGINNLGGQGLVLDADGRIVIAPNSSSLLATYNGREADAVISYEDVAPDGARRVVRYEPATGSNWAVVAQWPARLSQQLAFDIALPLLALLLLLAVAAYALLRLSLRSVTASVQDLMAETQRIASGDLKAPLTAKGADEIGRLSAAFESMRQTLQARGEEGQRLLAVSQGVASSLDVRSHIDPILEAALANGASTARLVFNAGANGRHVGFGRGAAHEKYAALDAQVLALTANQERVLLTNPARARLKIEKGATLPEGLAAFALKDGAEHLGALWLAFDQPQTFGPESVRYLEILAGQAANAASNARQYASVQVGLERVEALISRLPDPIVVVALDGRILHLNPPALNLFNLKASAALGAPIRDAIKLPELHDLLQSATADVATGDLRLKDGSIFAATAYPLLREGELIGLACILRDISQGTQAAEARGEFLSTLSHDLHDPLELMRGYLTMLGMVGELNEQQNSYIQKIEHNVERISGLSSSLLDSERISSKQGLQLQTFALADVLREAAAEIAPRARQKKVDLAIQPPPGDAPLVDADRTLLQRAIYHLIENAVRVSPRNGVVEIVTSFSKDAALIAVRDGGSGIAPVDLPKIFDRNQVAGSNLSGLAIVKSILDRHKGRAWAESELGLGSTFYLQVPLKQPEKA